MNSYEAEEKAKSYGRGLAGESTPQGGYDAFLTGLSEGGRSELDEGRQEAFERGLQDRQLAAAINRR